MPKGRPRKPPEQRIRKSTRGLGLVAAPEPDAVIVPDPPTGLLKKSKEIWRDYFTSPVSQAVELSSDRPRLERWILLVDEWHRTLRAMRKRGRWELGSQGQPVLSPLAGYLMQLEGQIKAAETELGMTPRARLSLGIAIGQVQKTIADLNAELDANDETDDEILDEVIETTGAAR